MLNILYDYEIFHAQRFGGISRYFVELIRALAGRPGLRLTVVAGFHRNELLPSLRGLPGVRILGWKRPAWCPGRRMWGVLNLILFRLLAPRLGANLYHATYYRNLLPGWPVPRVVTVHDMIHELMPANPRDPTAGRKARAVRRADLLLCDSANTRRDLLAHFNLPAGKTRVVHLGSEVRARPRPDRPLAPPYLLYVGDRAGYKNGEALLKALAAADDLKARFHLVYFGGRPFTEAEEDAVNQHGLGPQVHRVAGSDQDLATWYAHAFALVYPSRYEGFGLPPLEAMQFGCPVLASDRSSIPEIVGDAGRYFDPDRVESLVEAIRRAPQDEATRAHWAERGRLRWADFSWRACADRTLEAYNELMKARIEHG